MYQLIALNDSSKKSKENVLKKALNKRPRGWAKPMAAQKFIRVGNTTTLFLLLNN